MSSSEPSITPSGLVYLFGEQFVEQARAVGETLLYSGVKVKARELAEMLYGVALLALEANGVVRLELAQRKRLLGLASQQTVAVVRLGSAAPGGLEAAILAYLDADPARNDVAELLGRHLGQEMPDPWGHMTALVKRDLVARGFLHEDRQARSGLGRLLGDKVTVSAVRERIAPLAPVVPRVKALLADAQARRPQMMAQLWKDLRKGYSSREEKPESDSDD